jgi:hypothetical protein
MALCRTLDDIEAAAAADALAEPVRDQAWADRVALILAPHMPQLQAAAGP